MLLLVITMLVILVFLLHFGGSLAISMVLPIGVLIAFILMSRYGINANIMSLGGIAIAIGVMVDSGIVLIENIYRRLIEAQEEKSALVPKYVSAEVPLSQNPATKAPQHYNTTALTNEERLQITIEASQEVGKPVLFALLTTIIGFLPIFVLSGQAGKLFHPLAFTKTFAMAGAAAIALMILPTLAYYLLRGKLKPLEKNAVSRAIHKIYQPIINWSLKRKGIIVFGAILILMTGLFLGSQIKQEFTPPLDEGDLLFMPVLLPGASLTQVLEVMQKQDIIIKNEFPDEVEWVVGKLGRAETATDPAPVIMIETIVHLRDKKEWRPGMSREKLISEIQEKTKMPGVSPIMTQPIRNRIDMLATGIQTPVGIKIFGNDLKKLEKIGIQVEEIIRDVKGAVSPFAERSGNRLYYEIEIDRQKAARYGIKVADVQAIIMTAIGGMNLTTTVEGRERYPVRVRYMRELRDSPEALKNILVPSTMGHPVPLAQLANLRKVKGPAVIQAENTLQYTRVFINVNQDEIGLVDFVRLAQKTVDAKIKSGELKMPPGYYLSWSGQFEEELKSRKKLFPSLGIALFVILILLYIAFKSFDSLLILASGLPISLMGGIILLYFLNFKFSTAVWVGFIALFGVATDNAVVLLSTLDDLFRRHMPRSISEVRNLVIQGCLMRVRPAIMTTATTILALIPVMIATGTGAEIMKPMASPTVGGLLTVTLSNLLLVPVLYSWIKEKRLSN